MENSNNLPAIFNHETFGKLRVIRDEQNQPWFVARDVAEALGYIDTQQVAKKYCKRLKILKGVESTPLTSSPRGIGIIPESDLYRLIMRAALPTAERFQDWVVEEVLPQIRKTGGYIPITAEDDDLTIVCKALKIQQRTIEQKDALLSQQQAAIQALEPKAAVYDAHVAPDKSLTVYQFVRTLEGVNSISVPATLVRLGYFYRARGQYRAKSRYRETYFQEKYAPGYGVRAVYILDKGKKLLTKLYNDGLLPMKKGYGLA